MFTNNTNKTKINSIVNVSWLNTSTENETVVFYNKRPNTPIRSYDCERDLFSIHKHTIVNMKSEVLLSKSSNEFYITVKELAKICDVSNDTVRKFFRRKKTMIAKGNGGRPAKLKSVEHVNMNLVQWEEAKHYINKRITKGLSKLVKPKSNFRSTK
tara:strand:+ start:267 stop:734 length:468 start_codon:yes stop_codon:yes gene_type:complete